MKGADLWCIEPRYPAADSMRSLHYVSRPPLRFPSPTTEGPDICTVTQDISALN